MFIVELAYGELVTPKTASAFRAHFYSMRHGFLRVQAAAKGRCLEWITFGCPPEFAGPAQWLDYCFHAFVTIMMQLQLLQ